VSAENDPIDDDARPEAAEPETTTDEVVELGRNRPPDLVGTRPEWDPEKLVPTATPRAAAGRLWAPAGEGAEEEDAEALPAGAAAATATAEAPPSTEAPRYSKYSARFQFLLGALIAVGAAAVVLLVAVVVGGKDDTTIALRSGPPWSEWQPTATGVAAAEQIAQHVGREYRLPDGKQLVGVEGGALELAGLPVTIAIQQPVAQGGDIDFVEGSGVLYRMCGTKGIDCGIGGTPSENRHLLLRREALELALYSFRYLGVSETVVILPPAVVKPTASSSSTLTTSKASAQALLFRRGQPDVQTALAHPLTTTLRQETPSVSGVSRSPDARLVSAITNTKLFQSKFQLANQDARAILVLDPLPIR
jgi:hypothetical protein